MLDLTKINLISVSANISRVYEIAKTGNHTVKLIPSEGVSVYDIQLLNDFYQFPNIEGHCDMYCEVYIDYSEISTLFNGRKYETKEDIKQRINQSNQNATPSRNLSPSCQSLLKAAITKLNLGLSDTLAVIEVSLTIAQMEGSKDIQPQHIAEAIQYQTIEQNKK